MWFVVRQYDSNKYTFDILKWKNGRERTSSLKELCNVYAFILTSLVNHMPDILTL